VQTTFPNFSSVAGPLGNRPRLDRNAREYQQHISFTAPEFYYQPDEKSNVCRSVTARAADRQMRKRAQPGSSALAHKSNWKLLF
jgi:hypothetical protein